MRAFQQTALDRVRAAIPVVLIHAAILYALLQTQMSLPAALSDQLKLIDIAVEPPVQKPPPPPPPVKGKSEEKKRAAPREEGAASPPNIVSKATQIVAPKPVVPPLIPPPIAAATIAGIGSETSTGAAPVPGPGTGSGGIGNGTGSGSGGNGGGGGGGGGGGAGDGGDGGAVTRARHIRGRIRNSDYPHPDAHGLVSVNFIVLPSGRVTNCRTVRSSGDMELDQHTCRIIEQRYLYEPARDRNGRPVNSNVTWTQEWVSEYVESDPGRPRNR